MLSVYGRRHAVMCKFMSQTTNMYLKIPSELVMPVFTVVRILLRLSGRATCNSPLMRLCCFVDTSYMHFTLHRCVQRLDHMCVILCVCVCVFVCGVCMCVWVCVGVCVSMCFVSMSLGTDICWCVYIYL